MWFSRALIEVIFEAFLTLRCWSLRNAFCELSNLRLSLEASFETRHSDLRFEGQVLKDASSESLKFESSMKAFQSHLHLDRLGLEGILTT